MDKLNKRTLEIQHSWNGRPIAHPDHAKDLDLDAAINEFKHKLPTHVAEDEAYKTYVTNQRTQAIAHHWNGMRQALAVGDHEGARKHNLAYSMHVKAMGGEPVGPPPAGVQDYLNNKKSNYKFKAHKGDMFLMEPHEPSVVHGDVISSAPPPKK